MIFKNKSARFLNDWLTNANLSGSRIFYDRRTKALIGDNIAFFYSKWDDGDEELMAMTRECSLISIVNNKDVLGPLGVFNSLEEVLRNEKCEKIKAVMSNAKSVRPASGISNGIVITDKSGNQAIIEAYGLDSARTCCYRDKSDPHN